MMLKNMLKCVIFDLVVDVRVDLLPCGINI